MHGGLVARPGRPAAGRIDLVTVIDHEIGHLLGLDHSGVDAAYDLMTDLFAPGLRRLPSPAEIDVVLSE